MATGEATSLSLSSSSQVLDDENLVREILLRIPTKPLVLLRSVSKHWNSIISSHSFRRLHTSEPTSGVFIFVRFYTSLYSHHFLSLPSGILSPHPYRFQFSSQSHQFQHTSNGLLLFSITHNNTYFVFNPATSQFSDLPNLTLPQSDCVIKASLAFDPSRFDGFRVICVTSDKDYSFSFQFFMYSSCLGVWKSWEGNPFDVPRFVFYETSVYWNGAFHWMDYEDYPYYFDIETEKLSRFPNVPVPRRGSTYTVFCEFNGGLHCVDCDKNRLPFCKIFTLASYQDGWIVEYNVHSPEMIMGSMLPQDFSFICICKGIQQGRVLEMLFRRHNNILAYDLENKTWRTICDLEFRDSSSSYSSSSPVFALFDSYTFTATLAMF